MYFIATVTTMIYIISLLMLIRFTFSRTFIFWICPLLLNLILLLGQVYSIILSLGGNKDLIPYLVPTSLVQLLSNQNFIEILMSFIFALLFFIMMISFHRAIEATRPPRKRRVSNMIKNYNAALYAQKLEENLLLKEEAEKKLRKKYKTIIIKSEKYPKEWEKLFNEDN